MYFLSDTLLLAQQNLEAGSFNWTWALIGLGIVLVLVGIAIYNSLVNGNQEVRNAWSNIDVQLKRRLDLIPNLVETVKGYAKHEQETLEKVIQARNAAINAQSQGVAAQVAAENQLTGALKTIFALAEAYPDLKANENFKALQEELTSTENRIGFARTNYNNVATNYNSSLMRFPNNIVAGFTGFKPAEYFQLDPTEAAAAQKPPTIKF